MPSVSAPTRPACAELTAPAAVAAAAVAGVGLLAAVDPNAPGHYPVCPFKALTGWACPGCGTLRALHDLAHGDLVGALHRNPVTVAAVPVVVVAWVFWARRRATGRPVTRPVPVGVWWALVALLVAFGVARNLPGLGWLGPGR